MEPLIYKERWFAWRPVLTDDYRVVWLRNVLRSQYKILVTDKETLKFRTRIVWGYEL